VLGHRADHSVVGISSFGFALPPWLLVPLSPGQKFLSFPRWTLQARFDYTARPLPGIGTRESLHTAKLVDEVEAGPLRP